MARVVDSSQHDEGEAFEEAFLDDWDVEDEDLEPDVAPAWRRPLLVAIAALTVVALVLLPIYNVFNARTIADNGLEVCGFDYCIVQDAVRDAGLDLTMSRLSNTFLDETEARSLAGELTDYLGIPAVGLTVVDDLDRRLGGVYDSESRSVTIERPARAWTVLHEVAHAVAPSHGREFREVVIDLAGSMSSEDESG